MPEKKIGNPGMSIFSWCRVAAVVALILIILGGLGAAIWALVTYLRTTEDTGLFDVYTELCLRLADGQMGTVTGWGNVEYYGTQANVLQEAHVPIISDAVCNGPDYYDNQVTTTMFCAGYEKGGTDSCQGDSGGPFVAVDVLSKTSRYRLLGVVSWGTGCAMAKKPGVYTRVSRFLPWTSTAMRMYENSPGVHKMARAVTP
ncbi:serine protease hepsin-like [Sinocyclocheilus grahami]|uniref:serine protease hepsin-like n=1 Tax=Sinocyclocheilus grahami TaxID=75366 RepID=UPI0007AD36B0|nr:PREDICTED: serine protease hepsin-like [Sinocyclocheilus grahami]